MVSCRQMLGKQIGNQINLKCILKAAARKATLFQEGMYLERRVVSA